MEIAGILLVLFFIGYVIMSGILIFHWRMYAAPDSHLLAMRILFFIVSAALTGTALFLFFTIPWNIFSLGSFPFL